MKKRKGFTLTELIVVMAVSVIVIAILASLIVSVVKYSDSREDDRLLSDEMKIVEAQLDTLTDYDKIENVFSVDESSLTVTSEGTTNTEALKLSFSFKTTDANGETKTAGFYRNDSLILVTEAIQNITFEVEGRLIKCTVTDTEDKKTVRMIALRAANEPERKQLKEELETNLKTNYDKIGYTFDVEEVTDVNTASSLTVKNAYDKKVYELKYDSTNGVTETWFSTEETTGTGQTITENKTLKAVTSVKFGEETGDGSEYNKIINYTIKFIDSSGAEKEFTGKINLEKANDADFATIKSDVDAVDNTYSFFKGEDNVWTVIKTDGTDVFSAYTGYTVTVSGVQEDGKATYTVKITVEHKTGETTDLKYTRTIAGVTIDQQTTQQQQT